jgi:hypothetical protein
MVVVGLRKWLCSVFKRAIDLIAAFYQDLNCLLGVALSELITSSCSSANASALFLLMMPNVSD